MRPRAPATLKARAAARVLLAAVTFTVSAGAVPFGSAFGAHGCAMPCCRGADGEPGDCKGGSCPISRFGKAKAEPVKHAHILTQSGTNQWRGRLYGFLRNQRLDARNPLAPAKDPLTQAQYGASFGGPLRRDRALFFTPQDSSNLRDERGLADNDQRHRLTVSGSFEAPAASGGRPAGQLLRGRR